MKKTLTRKKVTSRAHVAARDQEKDTRHIQPKKTERKKERLKERKGVRHAVETEGGANVHREEIQSSKTRIQLGTLGGGDK